MDSATHALVGLALAGLRKKAGKQQGLVLTSVLASELPDLDLLPGLFNGQALLEFHRGWSHSWMGLAIAAGGLTLLFRILDPRVASQRVFTWAALALVVHSFLDLLTTYGTAVFYPFVDKPQALDVLFGIDLPLLAIFSAGVLFWYVGQNRRILVLALLAASVYIGSQWTIHRNLETEAAALFGSNADVLPSANPLFWGIIVDLGDAYRVGRVSSLSEKIQLTKGFEKNMTDPLVVELKSNPTIGSYLTVARYPYALVSREGEGWKIWLSDLRLWPHNRFNAVVQLDYKKQIKKIKVGPGQ